MTTALNGRDADEPEPIRVPDTRLAVIERRLAEVAEKGEQRVSILRDALVILLPPS